MGDHRFKSSAAVLLLMLTLAACGSESHPETETSAIVRSSSVDSDDQAAQLRSAAGDPDTVDDKLFVLWEYAGALRERDLAKAVLARTQDPEIKSLALLVRDGHQAGMNAMKPIAAELGVILPEQPTPIENAAIAAAAALPQTELEQFFLRRQRAMHAWDITVFADYGAVAKNGKLRRYVATTQAPLIDHARTVVRLSNQRGIRGDLTVIGPTGLQQ